MNTTNSVPRLSGILASLLKADFIVLLRNGRSLLLGFVLPLVLLFATTYSQKGLTRFGGIYPLVATSLAAGLMSMSLLGYSLSIARDREKGVFQRLRVTPSPTWAIMTSRLIVQLIACLLTTIVVLIVAIFERNLSLSFSGLILTIVTSLIGAATFLSIGQALVGLVKSSNTVNALGRTIYIGLFLLTILSQAGVLGSDIDNVAKWSPYGAVSSMITGTLNISSWSNDNWLALLSCIAYIVVFTAIGIRWFKWSYE